jgi:F0F1-type ATP synthase assembly protein I
MEQPNPDSGQAKGPKSAFEKTRHIRLWATAWSIGLSVVLAIIIGVALGMWLDYKLDTKPWFMLGGLICGIIAGFRNIFVLAGRLERSDRSSDNDNS